MTEFYGSSEGVFVRDGGAGCEMAGGTDVVGGTGKAGCAGTVPGTNIGGGTIMELRFIIERSRGGATDLGA